MSGLSKAPKVATGLEHKKTIRLLVDEARGLLEGINDRMEEITQLLDDAGRDDAS